MARKITWKSDDNQTCILTIDDGSNTVVNLTPAAEPFTTSIQESDDLFTPIRTSNGYIRIVVDSVEDIADLVGSSPLSRPVTLEVDVVNRWVGFLACESFTQPWDKGPIELEIPVVSPLEVTRGIEPSSTLANLGYINFAQFLLNMNSELGAPFYEFFFPVISNPINTLQYQFDMRNYANARDKNTGYEVASYYDILEDICKLFGWQAIEYEENLVFLAADVKNIEQGTGNNYRGYNLTRMRSIANGSQPTPSDKPAFTPNIPTILGADHNMTWIAGKKSVEVTGQLNERNETIWSMNVLEQCVYKGSDGNEVTDQDHYVFHYLIKKYGCYNHGNILAFNSLSGMASPDANGNNIKYNNYRNNVQTAYGCSVAYEKMYKSDWAESEIIEGEDDWKKRLILKAEPTADFIALEIHTNFPYDTTQNEAVDGIGLTGDILYALNAGDAFAKPEGIHYIKCLLRVVGEDTTYYFNHNSMSGSYGPPAWGTTQEILLIRSKDGVIDAMGGFGNTRLVFVKQVPAPPIKGEIQLLVYAARSNSEESWPGAGYIAIENFAIQLVAKQGVTASIKIEDEDQRLDENTRKISINNGFTDSWSQDCGLTLAREAVPDSYGVVLNASKTQPSALYDGKYPEDAMADRAGAYFSKARLRIKAIVKSVGEMLNPLIPYRFTSNGQPFICIEQQQNWRTNEVTGSFFEPTYNTL